MKQLKKPGRNFLRRAKHLLSLLGYESNDEELLGKLTKRSIVRFVDEKKGTRYLTGFEHSLYDKLKKKAEKNPILYENKSGMYINGRYVDTSDIYTQDPDKILRATDEYNTYRQLCKRTDTQALLGGGWSITEIDTMHYIDCYHGGGERVDWVGVKNGTQYSAEESYDWMVYIPEKLWCSAVQYNEAIEKIIEKRGIRTSAV